MTDIAPAEAPRASSIDKALNTKGFAEFLAKYPEAESIDLNDTNEAEIEQRLEAFEAKNRVSKEIRGLFNNQLSGLGIKLEGADFESVEAYLEDETIHNPESIQEMARTIALFQELPGKIRELEAKAASIGNIDELTAKSDQLWDQAVELDEASKIEVPRLKGLYFSSRRKDNKAKLARREEILAKHGTTLEGVNKKYEEKFVQARAVDSNIQALEDLGRLKQEIEANFKQANQALFKDSEIAGKIKEAVKVKIQDKYNAMLHGPGSFDTADKSLQYLDTIEETDPDYLEGMDLDHQRNSLNEFLEKKLVEEMREIVDGISKKSLTLDKVEDKLKKYLGREKIGTREGDELRDMLSRVFEKLRTDGTLSTAKKIIMSRVAIKLGLT